MSDLAKFVDSVSKDLTPKDSLTGPLFVPDRFILYLSSLLGVLGASFGVYLLAFAKVSCMVNATNANTNAASLDYITNYCSGEHVRMHALAWALFLSAIVTALPLLMYGAWCGSEVVRRLSPVKRVIEQTLQDREQRSRDVIKRHLDSRLKSAIQQIAPRPDLEARIKAEATSEYKQYEAVDQYVRRHRANDAYLLCGQWFCQKFCATSCKQLCCSWSCPCDAATDCQNCCNSCTGCVCGSECCKERRKKTAANCARLIRLCKEYRPIDPPGHDAAAAELLYTAPYATLAFSDDMDAIWNASVQLTNFDHGTTWCAAYVLLSCVQVTVAAIFAWLFQRYWNNDSLGFNRSEIDCVVPLETSNTLAPGQTSLLFACTFPNQPATYTWWTALAILIIVSVIGGLKVIYVMLQFCCNTPSQQAHFGYLTFKNVYPELSIPPPVRALPTEPVPPMRVQLLPAAGLVDDKFKVQVTAAP